MLGSYIFFSSVGSILWLHITKSFVYLVSRVSIDRGARAPSHSSPAPELFYRDSSYREFRLHDRSSTDISVLYVERRILQVVTSHQHLNFFTVCRVLLLFCHTSATLKHQLCLRPVHVCACSLCFIVTSMSLYSSIKVYHHIRQ